VTTAGPRGTAHVGGSLSARVLLGLCLVWIFACTGVGSRAEGEGHSNRAACERYVERVNALEPCLKVHYDADNLCAVVDATTADMNAYFECLGKHTTCDKSGPNLDVDRCEPPLVRLAG